MESIRSVVPCKPLAPYIGGKRNLARRLVQRIAKVPHECYVEAFVGMAGVFLRREAAPKVEVINDYSRDVANFFRVLQRHHVAFQEMLRFQVTSRVEFERLVATDPATLTDMERAARFLYLQRTTFGGKVTGRTFGVSPSAPGRFDVTKLGPMLADVHERLAGVTIECLPYAECLERYDRPGTLFYLDPPYWGSEGSYGRELFCRPDFERLAGLLKGLRGHFILSLNDVPEVRELFRGCRIEAVETTYTVGGWKGAKAAGELIISNRRRRRD